MVVEKVIIVSACVLFVGQDRTGQGRTVQDRTRQDRARTGQDRARTGRDASSTILGVLGYDFCYVFFLDMNLNPLHYRESVASTSLTKWMRMTELPSTR